VLWRNCSWAVQLLDSVSGFSSSAPVDNFLTGYGKGVCARAFDSILAQLSESDYFFLFVFIFYVSYFFLINFFLLFHICFYFIFNCLC